MTSPDNRRHVFIIRIWREPREIEGAMPEWRGVIESTVDNERRFLKSLEDIIIFILPYLKKMGVKLELNRQFKQWLDHHKAASPEKD